MKALVLFLVSVTSCYGTTVIQGGAYWGNYLKDYGSEKYYTFIMEPLSHQKATERCERLGGRLAVPKNDVEQYGLSSMGQYNKGDDWWIGVSAKYEGGQRSFWEHGVPVNYTKWLPGEPNNHMSAFGAEDCVSINAKKNGWNDIRCSTGLWSICEKDADEVGSVYKYTYFNLAGRGEVGRLLFALADVPYIDDRVETADWGALKYQTLWGVLPQLEVNEEGEEEIKICQSNSINRYLADKFGLMGKDKKEQFYIDMLSGCFYDIMGDMFTLVGTFGTPTYEYMRNTTIPKLPWWLNQSEMFLRKNNGGQTFFVGDKPTLADAMFYHAMWLTEKFFPGTIASRPLINAHYRRFEMIPTVARWLKDRPNTPYK